MVKLHGGTVRAESEGTDCGANFIVTLPLAALQQRPATCGVSPLRGDGGRRLPAIALTAFARPEDRMRALRAGFRLHIAKPVEPSELVASIASVLGRTDMD